MTSLSRYTRPSTSDHKGRLETSGERPYIQEVIADFKWMGRLGASQRTEISSVQDAPEQDKNMGGLIDDEGKFIFLGSVPPGCSSG